MSFPSRYRPPIDAARLRRILLDLLDIYSPSGKEEDIQLYLEELLTGAGFSVERQEVEEERYNLVANMGAGEPSFYLVGHVDTVPAWDLDDLGGRDEGEIIRGLGSADMKGGCAAMVEAWLSLAGLPETERPGAGLLLVVGEEEKGDGSELFLRRQRPDWVLIAEPTSLSPCFAHFGYLEAGFVTRGRRIHSSLPELGHNAIESMLRVLLHLGKEPLFDRERSDIVYSIREMGSSMAGFVVPDRCEARIDLHLPPETSPAILMEALGRSADSARRLIPDLDLELDFDFAASGYSLGTDNLMAQRLTRIYQDLDLNLRFDAFRSHSDGNLFHQAGIKPIILGPGTLETAHTPDEQTRFSEVLSAAAIYAELLLALNKP
jgi:acetylornithine deacetylase